MNDTIKLEINGTSKKDSWFSHIAIEVPGENASNEWCEPVTDDIYNNI